MHWKQNWTSRKHPEHSVCVQAWLKKKKKKEKEWNIFLLMLYFHRRPQQIAVKIKWIWIKWTWLKLYDYPTLYFIAFASYFPVIGIRSLQNCAQLKDLLLRNIWKKKTVLIFVEYHNLINFIANNIRQHSCEGL